MNERESARHWGQICALWQFSVFVNTLSCYIKIMKKCLSDSYIVLDWTKFVEMAVSLLVIRLPVMIAKTILVSKQNLVNTYNVYLNQSHIESFGPVTNMKRKWPCAPCKKYLKTFLTELIFITCKLLIVSFNKKKILINLFKTAQLRNKESWSQGHGKVTVTENCIYYTSLNVNICIKHDKIFVAKFL